ncbi:MAG: hypothetical protein QW555_07975 [Nitrososphaerota archaeon]
MRSINNLLWPGEVTLFYGPPGSGKTLTTLRLCSEHKPSIIINTETGDPEARALKHTLKTLFGEVDGVKILVARRQAELNNLLGGKSKEVGDVEGLRKIAENPALIAVDSITWHYAGEVKRAQPQYKAMIAQEFQGRVELWTRYLFQFNCPIIYTAQAKSRVGVALQDQPQNGVELEFIGGNALGHIAKTWVKFQKIDDRIRLTITRGENMGEVMEFTIAELVKL